MIEKLMNQLDRTMNRYGEELRRGANKEELDDFASWLSEMNINIDISEIIRFYRVVNGFEFNGLTIYSVGKESEIREAYLEKPDNFLCFGDDSISWYGYYFQTSKYVILNKPSADVMDEFVSFNDLMNEALLTCLS